MAAKKGNEGSGKIKFRFVEFEMDGAESSLEEGLKSIAAALNRGISSASPGKLIRLNGATHAQDSGTDDSATEEVGAEEEQDEETVAATSTRRPSAPRKVVPRKILEDFKLDDVEPTLKTFAALKNPKSDIQKFLVIAYWAKTYKKQEELSADHFFTAYRGMGWATPKDPAQPIRDLINPRNGRFSAGSVLSSAKINHLGEQLVIDMGKAA